MMELGTADFIDTGMLSDLPIINENTIDHCYICGNWKEMCEKIFINTDSYRSLKRTNAAQWICEDCLSDIVNIADPDDILIEYDTERGSVTHIIQDYEEI